MASLRDVHFEWREPPEDEEQNSIVYNQTQIERYKKKKVGLIGRRNGRWNIMKSMHHHSGSAIKLLRSTRKIWYLLEKSNSDICDYFAADPRKDNCLVLLLLFLQGEKNEM